MTLSPGKYRHLARCAPDGVFTILAIDHRRNLWESLAQHAPLTDAGFTDFKQGVIAGAAGEATAILTDPEYGLPAAMLRPGFAQRGLLLPLEVTDYSLHPGRRAFRPIPGWSVEAIRRAGGDGVKLLLYYHPDAANAATQREVVARTVADCAVHDLPLFLEPIAFSPDPDQPLTGAAFSQVVIESARVFCGMGIDVLKAEYPASPGVDIAAQDAALAELSAICAAYYVPWALLSAGVTYAEFTAQTRRACASGASGVIAGRALWGEAVALHGAARADFVAGECARRVAELSAICQQSARHWQMLLPAPALVGEWWHEGAEALPPG